nr:hypothetical protein [Tanacetum cinerariifolium]
HRPDPDTPLAETMAALDLVVRQGKALRPARPAGRGGRGLHSLLSLLAPSAGPAHRQVPRRHSGRFAGGQGGGLSEGKQPHARTPAPDSTAQRPGPAARPEPGPNGPGLDTEGRPRDVGAHWG